MSDKFDNALDFNSLWKKCPKSEGIPSIGLDVALTTSSTLEYIRWKAHTDWIQDVLYDLVRYAKNSSVQFIVENIY